MEKNPQNDLVYPGERVDDLQNGLYVIQNTGKVLLRNGCSSVIWICRYPTE